MFHQDVKVEVVNVEKLALKGDSFVHHVTFNVMCTDMKDDITTNDIKGKQIRNIKKRALKKSKAIGKTDLFCVPDAPLISCQDFCEIFPYHILFDSKLVIKQCGSAVLRWSNLDTNVNIKLKDVFMLTKPEMTMTYDNIQRFSNSNYILESHDADGKLLMKLRGWYILQVYLKYM